MNITSPTTASGIASLPIGEQLLHYASSALHAELATLLATAPDTAALSEVRRDLDGTIRWHVIDRCVLMANSGLAWAEPAANFAKCAELLRPYPVGHVHMTEGAAAQSLLDTRWHEAPAAQVVAGLLRQCLADGSVDVSVRLPATSTPMTGMLPLAASFVEGNALAARAIVDHIMTLDAPDAHLLAPLEGSGFDDILEYARSFRQPESGAVVSVVAEALMKLRLEAATGSNAPTRASDAAPVAKQRTGCGPRRRRTAV